jgi:hypothetical protein
VNINSSCSSSSSSVALVVVCVVLGVVVCKNVSPSSVGSACVSLVIRRVLVLRIVNKCEQVVVECVFDVTTSLS